MVCQAFTPDCTSVKPTISVEKSSRRALIESITVEVLNPKTALFFIAFLPQFVDPSAEFPVWIQLLIFGTLVNVILASSDLVCVYFAGSIVDKLRLSNQLARHMEGLGGSVLVVLGVNLALDRE